MKRESTESMTMSVFQIVRDMKTFTSVSVQRMALADSKVSKRIDTIDLNPGPRDRLPKLDFYLCHYIQTL